MASNTAQRTSAGRATTAAGFRETISEILLVALLFGTSLALAYSGVWFAQYFLEKPPGFEALQTVRDGMFRWDSRHYLSIATGGYAYDGDPCHEQNIVFMPAFPLLARLVAAATGLGVEDAGFVVVRLSLLLALILLFQWVRGRVGVGAAVFVTCGLLFSPGSFAFHAWYSESVMLLFLAVALTFHARGWFLPMGLAAAGLGVSRVNAVPFAMVFAGIALLRGLRRLRGTEAGGGWAAAGDVLAAALSVSGLAAWLWHLGSRFGDPLALIAAIKYCAWSKVHQPMGLLEFATLAPLVDHVRAALARPYFLPLDVKGMNLLWTLAALGASIWTLVRRRFDVLGLGFAGYFALTFYANGKVDWLESSFRHYVPMFTIYLVAHDVWAGLRSRLPALLVDGAFGALLGLLAVYMVLYQALFTVQRWHYF